MRNKLKFFALALMILIIFGGFGFKMAENVSLSDAVYFSVVTITTVGYGDISPSTDVGKAIAIFLIIAGGIVFVGLVSGITENIMSRREKQIRKLKLNVVVGVFFSELGNALLREFIRLESRPDNICSCLLINYDWTKKQFQNSGRDLSEYEFKLEINPKDLEKLRELLNRKSQLLLQLLINSNLMEHEMFTDLLQALSHLKEELAHREDLGQLPEVDLQHLKTDAQRAYKIISRQWLLYMEHIKKHYPYFFSFAVRNNPFNRQSSVVIKRR